MPITDHTGLSKPDSAWPGQVVYLFVHRRGDRAVGHGVDHLVLQPVPAADPDQAEDRQRHQRRQDHEELQHLVVDRRRQPAERDVAEHHAAATISDSQRGQPTSALITVASRNRLTPAMSTWATREADRVHQVRAGAEAPRMNSGTLRTFEP